MKALLITTLMLAAMAAPALAPRAKNSFAVGSMADEQKHSVDPIAAMQEKVEKENPKKQSKLYIKIVTALVQRAESEYRAADYDAFKSDIDHARTALANAIESAQQYHHDEKKDDLMLDPVERKLQDMSRSVALQDRPPVEALLKQVQAARETLVQLVFQDQ